MQFIQRVSRSSLATKMAGALKHICRSSSIPTPFSAFDSLSKLHLGASRGFATSTTFNFEIYMREKLKNVRKALDEAVTVKEPKQLYESMRYTLLTGRKIVPICCITACELVGGQESMAMPTACAAEMIHTGSLIYDDLPCLDNDEFRRGIPTNHKVYGEAVAMLAADALRTFAYEHMATATKGVSPERILWAISELAKAFGAEGQDGGQVLDVTSAGTSNVTLEDLQLINQKKAGAFGSGILIAGAIVGGGSREEVENLRKFGTCLGWLLQVADDIHDYPQDCLTDRVTVPKLIGIEKSVEVLKKVDEEATSYLAGFDPEKIIPLISLKNYGIYREKVTTFNFSGDIWSLFK